MAVRLRDRCALVEPATSTSTRNPDPRPDWTKTPKRKLTGVPFYAKPGESTPDNNDDPFLTTWTGYLPPTHDGCNLARAVKSTWRVQWDGLEFRIAGAVKVHKTGRGVRFLSFEMTRLNGGDR